MLCNGLFQIGLLYMATRVYVNMSQVFIGLYLQEALELPKVCVYVNVEHWKRAYNYINALN